MSHVGVLLIPLLTQVQSQARFKRVHMHVLAQIFLTAFMLYH